MNAVTVLYYQTASSLKPYREWLDALDDLKGKSIIRSRINRLRRGLFGNMRSVGGGVFELKIYFGPGYRIYCIHDGPSLVILLCGGDKKSQARDIMLAQDYARDYWRRKG